MEAGDHTLAAERAREALSTDLQTFLPDAEGGWAAEQRRELETIRLRALETLAEAGLRQGGRELGAAEQAARAAIAAAPFRESAHRLLMEVHEAAGNPAEALRAFEELRSLLREELGTTPGPGGDDGLRARAARRAAARAPRAGAPSPAAAGVAWEPAPGRRRWPPRSTGTRSSAAASSSPTWSAAGARRPTGQRALVLLAGDAGIGKTRHRGRAGRARPRRRRGRAVRALRRGDADARTSRWWRCCAGGRRARRWTRCATGSARARRSSRSCCRSSAPPPADHLAPARSPGPRPTRSASASSTPSPRCSARSAPRRRCVLVFDDLHWADRPTLQLLRHLVRAPAPRRVLFVGTYRESEISDRHPLHELIGDLRREGTLRRLELTGLAEAEVGELVAELASAPRLGVLRARAARARPRATRSSSRRSCATSATRPARCRRR